ncbi:MAG: branched-chain amino acid ABC transporter permease [Natronomonas sp.]
MGVNERTTVSRESIRDNIGAVFLGVFGATLVVDLLLKLAGVEVGILGGELSIGRLTGNFWDGILNGLLIGLAGIGLSMTYSILTFANFSHGDLVTVGGFTGWGIAYLIAGWGVVPASILLLVRPGRASSPGEIGAHVVSTPGAILAGLVFATIFTALAAVVIDRLVYRPMRDRSGISLLIASIGVALALRYVVQFVYGARRRGIPASVDSEINLVVATVDAHDLTLIVASLSLMLGLHLLLQRTKLGTAMRAMADNKDLALITGIPTERVVTATWVVGGGLAGAAGYLTVMTRGVIAFDFGWLLLLLIFAAVILGGIGSIYGAIAGGLIIGMVFSLSTIWIPADFNEAAAFAAMILALLFRPEGLFGGVSTA